MNRRPDGPHKLLAGDALANERTFLAYLRTALAFIGFGFVIARFSLFLREAAIVGHLTLPASGLSNSFGAWMALAGAVCAAFGGYRYIMEAKALRDGKVESLSSAAAAAGALAVGAIGLIVAFALPAFR